MTQLKAYKKPELNRAPKVKKLFIAGVGAIGSTLLKQVSRFGTEKSLRVIGLCNSKHMLWYDRTQSHYSHQELNRAPELDWQTIIEKLSGYEKDTVVFVDATGSQAVADLYPQLLKNHIHVVTPSKLANTQQQDQFDSLHRLALDHQVKFLYETNVGAGLPIIQSIKSLIQTGDKVLELNGVVSGTMTYLFSELEKGKKFSETVKKARQLGYAEPDPRDDLSGEDVARKFMILARICGIRVERDELEVESLIPESLAEVDSSTFLKNLHTADDTWAERFSSVTTNGHTLRYTGSLTDNKIKVGIQSVPKSSSLGQLRGTNNLIQIRTKRYNDQPLIIQGPGAGKEVTAAGVMTDILSIR